jgi:hypothetical protein
MENIENCNKVAGSMQGLDLGATRNSKPDAWSPRRLTVSWIIVNLKWCLVYYFLGLISSSEINDDVN